jgi:hypothetical protein
MADFFRVVVEERDNFAENRFFCYFIGESAPGEPGADYI